MKIGSKEIRIDLRNWSLWRILRMGFGILFVISGSIEHDTLLIAGGAFLMVHSLLSICENCATGSCETPMKK